MTKTYYWDRRPGYFVDKETGESLGGPTSTGMVLEWYLSLERTVEDICLENDIVPILGETDLVCGDYADIIFQSLPGYMPYLGDDYKDIFSGTLSNKFYIYKSRKTNNDVLYISCPERNFEAELKILG